MEMLTTIYHVLDGKRMVITTTPNGKSSATTDAWDNLRPGYNHALNGVQTVLMYAQLEGVVVSENAVKEVINELYNYDYEPDIVDEPERLKNQTEAAAPTPSDTPEPHCSDCANRHYPARHTREDCSRAPVPAETATEPTSYGIVEVIRDMKDEITKMTATPERRSGLSTITYWCELLEADLAKGLTERSENTKRIVADLEDARHISSETLNLRVQAASPDSAAPKEISEEIEKAMQEAIDTARYLALAIERGDYTTTASLRPKAEASRSSLLALIKDTIVGESCRRCAEACRILGEAENNELTALRSENERLNAIEENYKLLSAAVNEDDSECDDECDSYGHTDTCRYVSSAANLETRQREIEKLRAELASLRSATPLTAEMNELRALIKQEKNHCQDTALLESLLAKLVRLSGTTTPNKESE